MKESESDERRFSVSEVTGKEKESVCAQTKVSPPSTPRLTRVRSYDTGSLGGGQMSAGCIPVSAEQGITNSPPFGM